MNGPDLWRQSMARIVDRDTLITLLQPQRRAGAQVVFTNGCFDLLHAGHVRYLMDARSEGDLLVIGLNTDASVRLLKGPTRPFIPEMERAAMLASLRCVDYVCLFGEPTAAPLVDLLRPDVYVKGGDYDIAEIPEGRVVAAYGGRLVKGLFVEGRSTSELSQRIAAALDNE